jgi:multiple sugar transport system ATP-binding protein
VSENEFVARVSPASAATAGQPLELAFDTSKLLIFDGDSGVNLTLAPVER